MISDRLPVTLRIEKVRCVRTGAPGRAEPYVMAAFFEVDGKNARLTDDLSLLGKSASSRGTRPRTGTSG